MASWMRNWCPDKASHGRLYRIRNMVEKPKAADAPSNLGDHRALYSDA